MQKAVVSLVTIVFISSYSLASAETTYSPIGVGIKLDGNNLKKTETIKPKSDSIGKTEYIELPAQEWQVRRKQFLNAMFAISRNPADAEASKTIDRVLTEFERHQVDRTPLEAMDIVGLFYLPKEGLKEVMPLIVAEAILGWYDIQQWASESGKAEILNNEQFFTHAFAFGGNKKFGDEWSNLIKNDPMTAQKIVEKGLELAQLIREKDNQPGYKYDHKWPTAYGLERISAKLEGQPDPNIPVTPKINDEEAWMFALRKVQRYYLSSQWKGQ